MNDTPAMVTDVSAMLVAATTCGQPALLRALGAQLD